MQALVKCPESGLFLPREFIDEKQSLKKSIDSLIDSAVNSMQHVRENYFLTIHAMFDKFNPKIFRMGRPKASFTLPSFRTNTFVFWVSNKRGICELLWMVPPKKNGEKLKVEFNKEGVAYLQAKQAMPKAT